jgi:protein FAM50
MSRAPLDGYVGGDKDVMRMRAIEKQRHQEHQAYEARRRQLDDDELQPLDIGERFELMRQSKAEEQLAIETVGLQSINDFKRKKIFLEQGDEAAKYLEQLRREEDKKKKQVQAATVSKSKLSFLGDEDEEEASPEVDKKRRIGKDPTAETSFLPDRDRDSDRMKDFERRRQDEIELEEEMKKQFLEIPYNFYDGIDHRRSICVRKGAYIADFLDLTRKELTELRGTSIDNILFIKEGFIVPPHYTFYELLTSKAIYKGMTLFDWDVQTREKLLLHPAFVVDRTWYLQNRHVYPASAWRPYDPAAFANRVETDQFIQIFQSIAPKQPVLVTSRGGVQD